MTTTTTNYGWTIPSDTDLVTNGASAMRTLGQGIDTSLVGLKGGTTGQILSKTSGTDMAFTWITNDVGDITAVTTTAPLQGGASSGAVALTVDAASTSASGVVQLSDSTSTTSSVLAATPTAVKSAYDLANGAIAKTTVTTAGDIIYRNATVPTRLGIGTAGQVLTVNSGATAPQWATPAGGGGMTLINSGGTTLTSTITTISSIPATYKDLVLIIRGFKPTTIDTTFMLQLNGTTSSSYFTLATNTTSAGGQTFSGTEFRNATGMSNDADCQYNLMRVLIPDYANTTTYKMIDSLEVNKYAYAGATANWGQSRFMGTFSSASAISSIGITLNGVGWTSGTAYLYGVN